MEQLNRLGTLLGDHHNLVILLENLDTTSAAFRVLVKRKLRAFETQISAMGAKLYEEDRTAAVA
jgi:hypothetical protein